MNFIICKDYSQDYGAKFNYIHLISLHLKDKFTNLRTKRYKLTVAVMILSLTSSYF